MKWLRLIIMGLAVLTIADVSASATTYVIKCEYGEPCVECDVIGRPCETECHYEFPGSFTGWSTRSDLCPPGHTGGCMFQFSDSAVSPSQPRSVYWPDCTCNGSHVSCPQQIAWEREPTALQKAWRAVRVPKLPASFCECPFR